VGVGGPDEEDVGVAVGVGVGVGVSVGVGTVVVIEVGAGVALPGTDSPSMTMPLTDPERTMNTADAAMGTPADVPSWAAVTPSGRATMFARRSFRPGVKSWKVHGMWTVTSSPISSPVNTGSGSVVGNVQSMPDASFSIKVR
jgi:hypothetical protein